MLVVVEYIIGFRGRIGTCQGPGEIVEPVSDALQFEPRSDLEPGQFKQFKEVSDAMKSAGLTSGRRVSPLSRPNVLGSSKVMGLSNC